MQNTLLQWYKTHVGGIGPPYIQATAINDVSRSGKPSLGDDLFAQGFDSLSATFLRNRIIGALRSSTTSQAKNALLCIGNNFIFANPTIERLADALASLMDSGTKESASKTPVDAIHEMIAKYTAGIPQIELTLGRSEPPEKATVLLTGSTGGLGSYLLAMLLEDDGVGKVYAFNRSSARSGLTGRQRVAFEEKGLSLSLLSSPKLALVEGKDLENQLGLVDVLYDEIRASITHIIHNAWRLDFNLSLGSFEPNICGTRNLMQLAFASPYAAHLRFIFTSSVAVSQGWNKSRGRFPEVSDLPPETAVGAGYGEAKYVSEQILYKASQHGLRVNCLRIGQIAGECSNGYWSITDWVPILIKSSIALGALPDADGVSTWLKPETVAQTLLDVAFSSEHGPSTMNVVHPNPVSWRYLMSAASTALAKHVEKLGGKFLPLVSWNEWVRMLEERATSPRGEDLKAIPAIKLLDFYRQVASSGTTVRPSSAEDLEAGGITRMATAKAEAISPSFKNAPRIQAEDTDRWISYWKSKGLFE